MKIPPSIFNDVLGPVMRGPSSSHCAAALRIGRLALDLMDGQIKRVLVEYTPDGSLVTTHEAQGSDMGLYSGFLGYDTHDERLPEYRKKIAEAGIDIEVAIVDYGAKHPNTYKLTLRNATETRELTAISIGGGMIEVQEIDGFALSMDGGYHETLLYVTGNAEAIAESLKSSLDHDEILVHNEALIQIKSQHPIDNESFTSFKEHIQAIKHLNPVLPIRSGAHIDVPFTTCEGMLAYNADKGLELWELGLEYESARGRISKEEVLEKMKELAGIMRDAIQTGLQGTEYDDRILPSQSPGFVEKLNSKALIQSDALNTIISYVSAIMEVKSSMGVIVAAPTAGSCGAFPGCTIGTADTLGSSEEQLVRAMLIGGLIGVFIAEQATFAAEVGGCQAECGSGAGMAAAALVYLAGGTLDQSLGAASMALQNSLGMICDPIGNRVEAPCLGRNVTAASNALSCANMCLSNFKHLIPLDQVIQTLDVVGKSIKHELLCTNLGGLSVTPAAKAIEARLTQFKSC
jgi:L-serine dehydratase